MGRPTEDQLKAELDALQAIIQQNPSGLSRQGVGEILFQQSGRMLPERTLSRRLEQLVLEQRVRTSGRGRAVLYQPYADQPLAAASATVEPDVVPLSKDGAEVRSLVQRPIGQRKPVTYNARFLEAYVPGETWYLSADQRSALHELGHTPDATLPAGTYAREIYNRLLIDLAWASSHLEGNTYTRLDTQNLLEFGQRAEGKDAAEAQMILNHKAAIAMLVEQAEYVGFNAYTFFNLHAALSDNLLGDQADEGRLRTRIVNITGTVYTPLAVPQRVEELFGRLLTTADAIPDPFEQAFFVMVHLPYLQPFADVNKRTSRLAANLPLIKANLCPLSFVDVPRKVYIDGTIAIYELQRVELLRDVFLWAYDRSCQRFHVVRESLGEPDPFRLRYREKLIDLVREVVIGGGAPKLEVLRSWAKDHGVRGEDVVPFAELALSLLLDLHEGVLVRYRLTPSEFKTWKSQFAAVDALR